MLRGKKQLIRYLIRTELHLWVVGREITIPSLNLSIPLYKLDFLLLNVIQAAMSRFYQHRSSFVMLPEIWIALVLMIEVLVALHYLWHRHQKLYELNPRQEKHVTGHGKRSSDVLIYRKPKTVGNYDILQAVSNNKVTVHNYLLLGFAMLPAQKLGGKHLLLLVVIWPWSSHGKRAL